MQGVVAVVEDNPTNRLLLEKAVENSGYKVRSFSRATDYLAEEDGYLATFTDNSMPGMDGTEFVRRMRERGETHPICMVSSDISPDVQEVLDRHGVDHMEKPIDLTELRKYLQERLGTPTS